VLFNAHVRLVSRLGKGYLSHSREGWPHMSCGGSWEIRTPAGLSAPTCRQSRAFPR